MIISGNIIDRVTVVDDDPSSRRTVGFPLEELSFSMVSEDGPLRNVGKFARDALARSHAAICDHHLRVRNYADFNGAELVAQFYNLCFPAVLCTKWEQAQIDEIRRFRRHIPVLIKPEELNPDTIVKGFQICIEEFREKFIAARRPWRTLVRIADIDRERGNFYVIISGWNPAEVVRLRLDVLPFGGDCMLRVDARFHARVNIGAENQDELYFEDWESS